MGPMRCAHTINSPVNRRVSDNMAGHDQPSAWPVFLRRAPRHLFFTGKGGVDKKSLARASAILLGNTGQRVLIVSTDPASNLDAVLDTSLGSRPTRVSGVPDVGALNIDPEQAALDYRERTLRTNCIRVERTPMAILRPCWSTGQSRGDFQSRRLVSPLDENPPRTQNARRASRDEQETETAVWETSKERHFHS
jgi:Anion-transporting ATPase